MGREKSGQHSEGLAGQGGNNISGPQALTSQFQRQTTSGSGLPQPPLANYTLPGVISYITSEFTNLERFKIVANLEKSEMKYKIQNLTAEVNSLRYTNEAQSVRIRELEKKLEAVKLPANSDAAPPKVAQKSSDSSLVNSIPVVNLDVLKQSRAQLNRSIQDVKRLLQAPSGFERDLLNLPGLEEYDNGYKDLGDDDEFNFDHGTLARPEKEISVLSKYENTDDQFQPVSVDQWIPGKREIDANTGEPETLGRQAENAEHELELDLESVATQIIDDSPTFGDRQVIDDLEKSDTAIYPWLGQNFVTASEKSFTVRQLTEIMHKGALKEKLSEVLSLWYVSGLLLVASKSGAYLRQPGAKSESDVAVVSEPIILADVFRVSDSEYLFAAATATTVEIKRIRNGTTVTPARKFATNKPLKWLKWVANGSDAQLHFFQGNEVRSTTVSLPKSDIVTSDVSKVLDGSGDWLLLVKNDEVVLFEISSKSNLASRKYLPAANYALLPWDDAYVVENTLKLSILNHNMELVSDGKSEPGKVVCLNRAVACLGITLSITTVH